MPKIVALACVVGAALVVAGCHGKEHKDKVENLLLSIDTADSNGIFVKVTDARLVLPAVKGNPAAAYFTLAGRGKIAPVLTSVKIDGAGKTMIHETVGGTMNMLDKVSVPAGGSVAFAPGGKHVMVFGLSPKLSAGTSTRLTLTFDDFTGDKGTSIVISAPIKIESAGAMNM